MNPAQLTHYLCGLFLGFSFFSSNMRRLDCVISKASAPLFIWYALISPNRHRTLWGQGPCLLFLYLINNNISTAIQGWQTFSLQHPSRVQNTEALDCLQDQIQSALFGFQSLLRAGPLLPFRSSYTSLPTMPSLIQWSHPKNKKSHFSPPALSLLLSASLLLWF